MKVLILKGKITILNSRASCELAFVDNHDKVVEHKWDTPRNMVAKDFFRFLTREIGKAKK